MACGCSAVTMKDVERLAQPLFRLAKRLGDLVQEGRGRGTISDTVITGES